MEDEFIKENIEKLNKQVEKLRQAHLYILANKHQEKLDKILSGVVLIEKEKSFSLNKVFMRDAIIKQIIELESEFATEYVPKIEELNQKYNELKLDLDLGSVKDNIEKESVSKLFEKLDKIYDDWMNAEHTSTEKQVAEEKIAELTFEILIIEANKENKIDLNYVKNKEVLVNKIKESLYKKAENCYYRKDPEGDMLYNDLAQEVTINSIEKPEIWEKLTGKNDLIIIDEPKQICEKQTTELTIRKDNKLIRFFKTLLLKINPSYGNKKEK